MRKVIEKLKSIWKKVKDFFFWYGVPVAMIVYGILAFICGLIAAEVCAWYGCIMSVISFIIICYGIYSCTRVRPAPEHEREIVKRKRDGGVH